MKQTAEYHRDYYASHPHRKEYHKEYQAKRRTRLKELEHYKACTTGLRCIDQDPKDVDIERIRRNAFRLWEKKKLLNPK